jgi:hypothetical protein
MPKPRRPAPPVTTTPAGGPAEAEEVAALAARLREQLDAPDQALATLNAAPPALAAAALGALCRAAGGAARELLQRAALEAPLPVADAALAALATLADPAAAASVAELAEQAPDKARRKAARRALFRLRSLGVALPVLQRRASPTTSAQPRAIPYRALASHIDGLGSRLLWIFADRPLGGAYWFTALLNDLAGLKDFGVRDTTRKRLAAEEAAARGRAGFTWVELPVSYAQWLLQEAVALNAASGFPLPTEYHAWREVVGTPAEPIERPLIYEHVSRFEVKMRPELLEEAPRLFAEPEVEGWLFGYRDVQKYATELRRAREARLVLTPESEEQRHERVLTQAIRDLVTPTVRRALQRRLEETAYLFWATDRREQAKRAVAAAVELADRDPLLLPRHPFVRALVERSIELAIQAERAGIDPSRYERSPYDPID